MLLKTDFEDGLLIIFFSFTGFLHRHHLQNRQRVVGLVERQEERMARAAMVARCTGSSPGGRPRHIFPYDR